MTSTDNSVGTGGEAEREPKTSSSAELSKNLGELNPAPRGEGTEARRDDGTTAADRQAEVDTVLADANRLAARMGAVIVPDPERIRQFVHGPSGAEAPSVVGALDRRVFDRMVRVLEATDAVTQRLPPEFLEANHDVLATLCEALETLSPEALAALSSAQDGSRPQEAVVPTGALADIAAERLRQVQQEGWTPEHDDEHDRGELARAGALYAYHAGNRFGWPETSYTRADPPFHDTIAGVEPWPWYHDSWKPKDPRRDLVRAGALITAEIERLDRLATPLDDRTARDFAQQNGPNPGQDR